MRLENRAKSEAIHGMLVVKVRAGEIESHPSVPPSVTDLAAKRPKILGFFAGFTEKRYNF